MLFIQLLMCASQSYGRPVSLMLIVNEAQGTIKMPRYTRQPMIPDKHIVNHQRSTTTTTTTTADMGKLLGCY